MVDSSKAYHPGFGRCGFNKCGFTEMNGSIGVPPVMKFKFGARGILRRFVRLLDHAPSLLCRPHLRGGIFAEANDIPCFILPDHAGEHRSRRLVDGLGCKMSPEVIERFGLHLYNFVPVSCSILFSSTAQDKRGLVVKCYFFV